MGVRPMFEVPDGWVARGFVFEVETTSLAQPTQVAQAFGARRYAYNWALGQVKANLDARGIDPTVPTAGLELLRASQGVEPGQI